MAFLDQEVVFADNWLPPSTGDNIGPTTWDSSPLGNPINTNTGRDLGPGTQLLVSFLIQTTCLASGGAATATFELVTDSTSTITTVNVLVASPAIPKASLVSTSGSNELVLAVPRGGVMTTLYKKFLGVDVNVATNPLTAGAIQAKLLNLDGAQDRTIYLPGYSLK
jgi:hypothetical protein